jgi:transposase InsO family protein
MGPAKWSYFYLYVIIDIFSRRIVAWCIADAESAKLGDRRPSPIPFIPYVGERLRF